MTQLNSIAHIAHMPLNRGFEVLSSSVPNRAPTPLYPVAYEQNAQNQATPAPVGSSTVADATADRFTVELVADHAGPPWPIRMRKWLKEAGRAHGLTCMGVTPVAEQPTGHRPATNAEGEWRTIRRVSKAAADRAARERIHRDYGCHVFF
jgi:hypothetical protein